MMSGLFIHGFEVSWMCELCWVFCPLDTFKITALLVSPTALLWCRPHEVLVSNW